MPKISDEQIREEIEDERHDAIVGLLREIAARPNASTEKLESLMSRAVELLIAIQKKETGVDLSSVLKELAEIKPLLTRPTSFTVERNKLGFIEKVIPVYE